MIIIDEPIKPTLRQVFGESPTKERNLNNTW